VLTSLAAHFGIQGQVQAHKVCLDPQLQWGRFGNIWHDAGLRTVLYLLGAPFRWVGRLFRGSGSKQEETREVRKRLFGKSRLDRL
jgi:hypothetical protein